MISRETYIHIELCRYIALAYPTALFQSDTGSGVKLNRTQARIGAQLRKKRGHPDIIIYDGRGGFVGCAMELKSESTTVFKLDGSLRKDKHLEEQSQYGKDLQSRGWYFTFAIGLDEAIRKVDHYMKGRSNV
jgi:hypothetical protein